MVITKVWLKFIRRQTFIRKYYWKTCFETPFWFLIDVINVLVLFLYIFLPSKDVSIFWINHHSVFLNHLYRGIKGANSILRNQNRICDEHQSSKRIDLNFVHKRKTGLQSNGGTSHFILCETKIKNESMLCMTIFRYCVWQFVYLCMKFFLCCVWHIFIYYVFLYLVWN